MLSRALLFALLLGKAVVAQTPVLSGILNSGDYTTDVSQGSIVSVFGQNLATQTLVASQVPLPDTLDGVSIELVTGSQTVRLPLFFISPGQINAQLPYGITGTVQVRVRTARGVTSNMTVQVLSCAPKLFTWTKDGKGEAVTLHADYRPVNASGPARPGEVVIVYLTGLGAVAPPVSAGTPAGDGSEAAPINYVVSEPIVRIGGQPAKVLFAGLAPYFAGLYQLNVQLPDQLPSGANTLSVSALQSGSQENVTMAVNSSWQPERSLTIGPAGGSLAGATASLSFPAGAVSAAREMTLYRNSTPASGPGERFRVSDVIAVSGLPDVLAAPVTVSFDVTRNAGAGAKGQPFVVLRTNEGSGDGVIYLDARIEGGKASVTIPALNSVVQPKGFQAAAMAPVRSTWTMYAIAGYYALRSEKDHFRVIFPAEDLIEGGAEEVAAALETAYTKIETLGLSWTRRNGISSWPIDVSVEYFDGDRKDRLGEEGSTRLGVQRQGINLNANFLVKRENFEKMRITSGHELFHLMQNLYDLESAPSTWLWMEEAMSTWFERRMAKDPQYVPTTVAPAGTGSTNYTFFRDHSLEYPPGDPSKVQEHGYGASMLLESMTRRHGDQIIGNLVKSMGTRAQGIFARPLYSPAQAVQALTTDVGAEWHMFCESFMAGKAYGDRPAPQFPAPDLVVTSGETYRWTLASDTGPTWDRSYPDLSARVFYVDLRGPKFATGTKMTISLDGGGASAAAIVYRIGPAPTDYVRLGVVRDTPFQIANAETLVAAQQRLVVMVVNSRSVAPYTGSTQLTLRVRTGASLLDWLQQTKSAVLIGRTTLCFFDTNNRETCQGNDFTIANDRLGQWAGTPPLTWSGTKFSAKGRTTIMHDQGGNFDIDFSGEVDPTGMTIKSGSFKVKNYNPDGTLSSDWDVEIFQYPVAYSPDSAIAGCTNCSIWYEPRGVDWSQRLRVNKFSTYSTLNGQTREVRRYSRTQSVSSSWVVVGRP